MGRTRGFSLKHRVATVFRRFLRCRNSRRLATSPLPCLTRWTVRLKRKAKEILCRNMGRGGGYIRVGNEPFLEWAPKGHMAVYVGQKDGDFQRIYVPIVYINHPLFGDLLRESEKEFGFDHPGGLTIPCQVSEFERVQTRIKEGRCTRKWK